MRSWAHPISLAAVLAAALCCPACASDLAHLTPFPCSEEYTCPADLLCVGGDCVAADSCAGGCIDESPATGFCADHNPCGSWTYGWARTHTDAFQVMASRRTDGPVACWTATTGDAAGVCHNPSGSQYGLLPPGAFSMHPGPTGDVSILRWTAPRGGDYRVTATFSALDVAATTDTTVRTGATVLHQGAVTGPSGDSYSGEVHLEQGATMDFMVGWGANQTFISDTTGLQLHIASK